MRQNMVAAAVDLGFPTPGSASPRPNPRESGRRRPDWAAGGGGWIGRGASGSNWDRGGWEAHERRKKQHAFLFGLSLGLI